MNDKDKEYTYTNDNLKDLMKFIQMDEIITYTENQILLEEYEEKSGIKRKKMKIKIFMRE